MERSSLFDLDFETPTTDLRQHLWYSVAKHIDSLLEVARLHRSVHEAFIVALFKETAPENKSRFFRDMCTVGIHLPQRSSLVGWMCNRLTEKDLYISRSYVEPGCKAIYSEHLHGALDNQPADFIPRFVVIHNSRHYGAHELLEFYQAFGKDPIKQTFILLN